MDFEAAAIAFFVTLFVGILLVMLLDESEH